VRSDLSPLRRVAPKQRVLLVNTVPSYAGDYRALR
jgi:hypothetical protein